jgi:MarR family transcriptional regulator, lower aerobic nicotinate degradation pathway regulator
MANTESPLDPPQIGKQAGSPFALGLLLRQAHHRMADAMDGALRPLQLERRHLVVLMHLTSHGPQTQRELVERTQHDKASMVRIVDDLERLGLASREPVPGDRRARAVTLTPHGREVYAAAWEAAGPVARDATASLTSRQLAELERLLRRFIGD